MAKMMRDDNGRLCAVIPLDTETVTILVTDETYAEIRKLLIDQGRAGYFNERGPMGGIELTGVTIKRGRPVIQS